MTTLTKSKPYFELFSYVKQYFMARPLPKGKSKFARLITVVFFDFPWVVSFLIELD